jgi:hypothetical protein
MRRLFFQTIGASSILLLSVMAYAQNKPRTGSAYTPHFERIAYQERAVHQSAGYREPAPILEQLRTNLNRVEIATPRLSADWQRIAVVRKCLAEFARGASAGIRDDREFENLVSALREVVNENTMSPRSRELLMADLNHLTDWWIDLR